MSLPDDGALLSDCRSGWLMVEEDFSARLTRQEQLKHALQCMGRNPSDRAVQRHWNQCRGSMSFDQFCMVMKRERRGTLQDLVKAFRKIDSNGDGFVTAQELQRILTKRGEKMPLAEVQAIIDEADYNRDGKLDYSEFCHMLLSTSEACSRATRLRADVVLKSIDNSSQTGQTGRKGSRSGRSHSQMRDAQGRRAKRREEIRSQLYSGGSSVPVVGEGPRAEPKRVSTRELTPSGTEVAAGLTQPILTQKQIGLGVSSSASHDGIGVTSRDSTATGASHSPELRLKKKTDTAVLATAAAEDGTTNDSRSTGDTRTVVAASGTPPESQPLLTEEERGDPLGQAATGEPTDLAAEKVLSDPFDESSKERPARLPPLKAALPPVLPPLASNQSPTETSVPAEGRDTAAGSPPKEGSEGEREEHGTALETREDGARRGTAVRDAGEERAVTVAIATTNEASGSERSLSRGASKRHGSRENQERPTHSPSEEQQSRETEGGEGRRQPSHSASGPQGRPSPATRRKEAAPSSVVPAPPKRPSNLEAWNSITGQGCFYLDVEEGQEEGVAKCHHYRLNLPSPTNVWVEMGVATAGHLATDALLFIFHTNENEELTHLIIYTQHVINQRWVCRLDLDAGNYALVPFTSGCHLKPREVVEGDGVPLVRKEGGKTVLTEQCREALTEIFHRIDLDGNGVISRTEFDFFQERTSGEVCDDETWKIIQDNFEMTGEGKDEITLEGFLALHVMTAEDEEGGEEELWEVLSTLGYSRQLQLDQACPFQLEVFTEDCEGEIEIVDLSPFGSIVDPALSRLVVERGVCEAVRDGRGELQTYTFSTPHMTTIVLENKGNKRVAVQLDCSRSTHCQISRESSVHVMHVEPQSTVIGFHLMPESATDWTVHCVASRILS